MIISGNAISNDFQHLEVWILEPYVTSLLKFHFLIFSYNHTEKTKHIMCTYNFMYSLLGHYLVMHVRI